VAEIKFVQIAQAGQAQGEIPRSQTTGAKQMTVDTQHVAALRECAREAIDQCQDIEKLELAVLELTRDMTPEDIAVKFGDDVLKLLIELTMKHDPETFVQLPEGKWMLRERLS
jgi:hypothetical protein